LSTALIKFDFYSTILATLISSIHKTLLILNNFININLMYPINIIFDSAEKLK
jgi:hypothetical protein